MGKIARLASLGSVFAGLVGFLYLWGYWRRFGINFLEFATLTDLVRLSLEPVVRASLFGVAIYTLQIWLDVDFDEPRSQSATPPAQAASPQAAARKPWKRRLVEWGKLTILGLIAASFLFALWQIRFRDHPQNWQYLAPSLGLAIAFWLVVLRKMRVFELSARQTGVCIFLAVFLPLYSYGTGAVRAKAVATGTASGYSDATVSNGGSAIVGQARYLGTLGQFAFFWTSDETVRIANWDQVLPLELGRPSPKPDADADAEGEQHEP